MKKDKTIICKDCGKEFIFTVGEQEFFEEKGLMNDPVRCKECRDKKRARNNQYNNKQQNNSEDMKNAA